MNLPLTKTDIYYGLKKEEKTRREEDETGTEVIVENSKIVESSITLNCRQIDIALSGIWSQYMRFNILRYS